MGLENFGVLRCSTCGLVYNVNKGHDCKPVFQSPDDVNHAKKNAKPDDKWRSLCEKYTDFGQPQEGQPYGWIQWKGTDVCMDVHCACGKLVHVDAEFAYLIGCATCKRVYWPSAHILLKELPPDEVDGESVIEAT